MAWVRLDDAFPEHPKVLAVGEEAAWLYVCVLCYCNRHLTDGFLPAAAVPRLTGQKSPSRLTAKLVDAGLLDIVRDGFFVHDYLEYQMSKASIENERAGARERMAKVRERSKSVHPNTGPNVRANIAGSAPYPNPNPSQDNPSSSSSSNGSGTARPPDDDDDRVNHAIEIHAAWAARSADNPRSYQRAVKANDRRDSVPQLLRYLETHAAVTAQDLARDVFDMSVVDVRQYDPRRK